ncbi:GntR family transcriptional regulator [Pontibacillus chungwhensis BH030062]|uniref:GntR family transcriptional regulator n=1 Tax=Pontibacillus chungwhensis BH030062 TaxID=1385513 RepID=A0A0A2USC8_9BACI|nr:GntR family transcriptional regulator [Pontibacillus chungwhensis]KGP91222.1 GntR family transcriptional regulator [Pontibacillus chungwhensis BH030062]
MNIILSNRGKQPIYEQIYEQIRDQILSHELKPGYSLPSMRQLAKELNVSLITSKRAYEELEKDGFIYSVVGRGSFVSDQNEEMIKESKMKGIEEQLAAAVHNSKDVGLTLTELQELLTILYREEE